MRALRIFIGYDDRQQVSYNVLHQSIIKRASQPVAITPLVLETLPITRRGLTPFTFSRFLVPWLCDYEGVGLFIDSDMLVLDDIAKLFEFASDHHDVSCAQNGAKYEWSSVMLFQNDRCGVLTPEYIQSGPNPMTMAWARSIGMLPPRWNHLVGYDMPTEDVSLVHFTQGVPCWPETTGTEHAGTWLLERFQMNTAQPWETLMGSSVHAKPVRDRLAQNGAH